MRTALARLVFVALVACLTLGAVSAHKREKKSSYATFHTLAAAHYLACPEVFGEEALARYLQATSSRLYREYRHAAEFDLERRDAILEQTRSEIRSRALEAHDANRFYTLKDVEFAAGTYDLTHSTIGFRVAESVIVSIQQPMPGHHLYRWSDMRAGAKLPPASVSVYLEYPREAPFAREKEGGVVFLPVEQSQAEVFAAAYPAGNRVNLDRDGWRKAHAYLDVELAGCKTEDPRFSFSHGMTGKVVGLRIYAMSSYDRSAQGLVFEWSRPAGIL